MPSAELTALLDAVAAMSPPADVSIDDERAAMDAMAAMLPEVDGAVVDAFDAGGVPAERVQAPGADADKAILYLHGGGYATGSFESHRTFVSRLCQVTGWSAVHIEYRLAPEHPHPAAVDDGLVAYRWMLDSGISPGDVVVAGESAGAGLVVAVLVAARDAGLPMPMAAICISPWVDLTLSAPSVRDRADVDPWVAEEMLALRASQYLAGADPTTPLASPIHADLSGLPRTLVIVGSREILYDDATGLVDRLKQVGIEATFESWEGLFHGFPLFAGALPEADEALAMIARYVREGRS